MPGERSVVQENSEESVMGVRPNKIHISGANPLKAQRNHGVEMVETFCERFVPQGVVIPASEYRTWVSAGRTVNIFCNYCRREALVEEGIAATA